MYAFSNCQEHAVVGITYLDSVRVGRGQFFTSLQGYRNSIPFYMQSLFTHRVDENLLDTSLRIRDL